MSKVGAVGIDFGTTKTMLVYAEKGRGGHVVVDHFPTVILFTKETDFSWADHKIGLDVYKAPNAWKNFKKFMSEERVPVQECCDAPFKEEQAPSPVLLAAFIFRHLKQKLEQEYGQLPDEIGPVTITIPSECNFRHRQAVIFAANVAGFKDVNILEEPVAAYLMHYLTRLKSSQAGRKTRVFVIDFGGGTCDLAVIESQHGEVPIVLSSRTVDRGGNDIDDAIVALWKSNPDFGCQLPPANDGEYDARLIYELRDTARNAKHQCNPRPEATPQAIQSLLKNPLASQRGSEGDQSIELAKKKHIKPPRLAAQDFNRIMADILQEIGRQISYLFPTDADIQQIDKVVFAGGSCYIRQLLEFILERFKHLKREQDFLFNDPEIAIALGALEYQRERNESRNPVHTRLSLSTYLQVDYESTEIPGLARWLTRVPFIFHHGRTYILLAARGEPLKSERPNVSSTIFSLMAGAKHIVVPFRKSNGPVTWKVFQVRSEDHNKRDYEAITDRTRPIDEISFSPNLLDNAFNSFNPIRFIYAFDIYGDFYRNARFLSTRFSASVQSMHEKNPMLDWRIRELVWKKRQEFFGGQNGRNR